MDSEDDSDYKKSALLSYWLNDYTKYLKQEKTFSSTFLPTFHQGDIIEVNFGYRVGNEFGGKHFAMVLDKKSKQNYPVITVVPLSSKKATKKEQPTNVDLGDCLYKLLHEKNIDEYDMTVKALYKLEEIGAVFNKSNKEDEGFIKLLSAIDNRFKNKTWDEVLDIFSRDIEQAEQLSESILSTLKRIEHMKNGSIAVLNQVTTISKMRIIDPLRKSDSLYGIRLSQTEIDLIVNKFKTIYLT